MLNHCFNHQVIYLLSIQILIQTDKDGGISYVHFYARGRLNLLIMINEYAYETKWIFISEQLH